MTFLAFCGDIEKVMRTNFKVITCLLYYIKTFHQKNHLHNQRSFFIKECFKIIDLVISNGMA